MPPIISKIIPLKGGFPKGGIKSGPRNPPRGKDYKQSPPYRGIFTHIYFLQCSLLVFFCISNLQGSTGGSATFLGSLFLGLEIPDDERVGGCISNQEKN